MSRLNSLVTQAALIGLADLQASPDGPELVALAFRKINRTAQGNEDAAAVARIAFAGYPGFGRLADLADGTPVWPSKDLRKSSIEAAAVGATKRALAADLADTLREEASAVGDTADLATEEEASAVTYRNTPDWPTDAIARTSTRTRLGDTLRLALADGAAPDVIRAIAYPGRQTEADGMPTVRTIVRALNLPTGGRRFAASQTAAASALADTLNLLRRAGQDTLRWHAMRAPRPVTYGPVCLLPSGKARTEAERPGGVFRTGQAVWHRGCESGPIFSVGIGASDVPVRIGRVCERPAFLAPDAAASAGSFVTSARPLPGVTPGGLSGSGRAGQGKAVRPSAPRKRKRDGGIGSPMI